MGKAIIITTPRPTQHVMGQAIVVSTDANDPYTKSFPGAVVEYESGPGEIGDVVNCKITAATTCDITSVIGPSTLAQGDVSLINMDELHRCEFKVDILCEPNPYGIKKGDKLQFKDPAQEVSVGDTVGCIPTAVGVGQLVKVIHVAV